MERPSRVPTTAWKSKYLIFFFLKFEIEFCPYPECPSPKKRNHPSFLDISPTLVIDTSMERASRVLHHGNPKFEFFSKKF